MVFDIKSKSYLTNNFTNIRHGYLMFMLSCLLIRNIGVYSLAPVAVEVAIFSAVGILGIALLGYGVISRNIIIEYKENIFLILFICCFALSCVLNIKYGFFNNLKDGIWTLISFFVIYLSSAKDTREDKIKIIYKIQNIIIYSWMILSLLSICTVLMQIQYVHYVREDCWVGIGLVENRLYGVFLNPNSASIISFFALIFSAFQLCTPHAMNVKKKWNILNIVAQFIYIALSESRGTYMVLLLSVALVMIVVSFKALKNRGCFKNKYCISVCAFLAGILSGIVAFAFIWAITKIFTCIPMFVKPCIPPQTPFDAQSMMVKRTDFIDNNDISNLRFKIWISAWEIFKGKWLFGVTAGNVVAYAKDVLPNTFMAQRKYFRAHSVWFGIPLYTGVCGAFCLFAFFLRSFIGFVKYYIGKSIKHVMPLMTLSIIIVINVWVYGLVESEILFVNSACSFVFWLFMGFANDYLKSGECRNPQNLSD